MNETRCTKDVSLYPSLVVLLHSELTNVVCVCVCVCGSRRSRVGRRENGPPKRAGWCMMNVPGRSSCSFAWSSSITPSPPLRLSAHDGILARPVVLDCRLGILPKRTETNADRPPLSSDDHKRPQATTTTDHKRRPATTSAARLGVRCFPRRSLVVTRDPHWQFCQPACRFDVLSISPKRTTVAAFYSTIHKIHTILGMCVE